MSKYRFALRLIKKMYRIGSHAWHRFWKTRKRTRLILIIAVLINTGLVFQILANTITYPNTYLQGSPIQFFTRAKLDRYITSLEQLEYRVRVRDREYPYTLSRLGVYIDKEQLFSQVYRRNRKPFPLNAMSFLASPITRTDITIPLVFSQEFHQFINDTVFDFSLDEDRILFDPAYKTLAIEDGDERYILDEAPFRTLLASRIGDTKTPLYPTLQKQTSERRKTAVDTSMKLAAVFAQPLTVYLDTGNTTRTFHLSEKELTQMTIATVSALGGDVRLEIEEELFTTIINDKTRHLGLLVKGNVATPNVRETITDALKSRLNGNPSDVVHIFFDQGPNTTGTIASKYIEVDISQQKLYLFAQGKAIKEYRVSTGIDEPTPTGKFEILNKTGLGYSNIYDVWMPWWMGFYFDPKLHAYFGIHELPFTLVGDQKIGRSLANIGQPTTGGCVALAPGAAAEVYRFADIGTVVVIYN